MPENPPPPHPQPKINASHAAAQNKHKQPNKKKNVNPKAVAKPVKAIKNIKTLGEDVPGKKKEERHVHRCFKRGGDERFKDWYTIHVIKLPILITLFAKCSLYWEIFMYIIVVLDCLLSLFGIFFTYHNGYIWNCVFATNCIFGLDVLLRLSIELWRYRTQSEFLVFTLPYRFIYCIMDLLSMIPIRSLVSYFIDFNNLNHLAYLDLARINTLIRVIPRVLMFFGVLEELRLLSEELLFIVKFFNIYLAFINFVSCCLFLIVNVTPVDLLLWRNNDKIQNSWARDFALKKPSYTRGPLDMYILTTHFSTATVTTVGYGDLHGETEVEMTFCIVIMLIGAIFLNGYFTSQITNFQLELDGVRFDLFHRLDAIKNFLAEAGMGIFFTSKVEYYYNYLWTYRFGVDKVIFIDNLPRSLQEDVYYDVCLEMFHKSFLFEKLDEAFLRAVSKIVKIALYNPDMILCRYGGYANTMFYILQGECQAMSKHDSSKRAAILRAGSIIGEVNLFFSCPYTVSVETNTCCQFISIDKEDLMNVFNKFPTELAILRARSQKKINQMYQYYQLVGLDPVCWVEKKNKKDTENDSVPKGTLPTCIARWGNGFNKLVTEDVLVVLDRFVIFETPCLDKKIEKNHVTPYMTCVVPEILNSKLNWVRFWNYTIMTFALIYSFVGPYCFSFGSSSNLQYYICKATTDSKLFEFIIFVVYALDLIVEVLGACPVEGLYFQFWDGIQMKTREILFYLDILCCIPFEWFTTDGHDILEQINVILKSTKIWKVIRYLKYLENIQPKNLFWFRLAQTFMVLMYGMHFIACFMFTLACPYTKINGDKGKEAEQQVNCLQEFTWLSSYKTLAIYDKRPVDPEHEPTELGRDFPYLLSFYFSAATLTSAGFGDFSPQSKTEIIFTIFIQLIGFFIIGYYTALLTSALACVVKPRLEFQQKLISVKIFMKYYAMPELLQRRVVEHYELQHQYRNEVNLPYGIEHFLYDAPEYLKNDALYTDVVLLLDGIPLFSKTEAKNIIKLSGLLRRYLIPPNVKFLHLGEVRRTLYAIRSGSMGIFDDSSEDPVLIIEGTSYFGLRDLLFGEPARYNFKTLSYCVIYEITHKSFLDVFDDDEDLMDHLEQCKETITQDPDELKRLQSNVDREKKKDRSVDIPSWIWYKPSISDKLLQMKYLEYSNFFDQFAAGKLLRYFLQSGVVHPAGFFSRVWASWMSLVSIMILSLLMMETFMYFRSPTFRYIQYFFEAFFYIDIYVKLHLGYYLADNILVAHPLKTAAKYIFDGSFFFDCIFCSHPEQITWLLGLTNFMGYGQGSTWHTKLRWSKFFQIRRVPQIFEIIHEIFVNRTFILLALYVGVTLIVCTIVASIALYIGCPWSSNDWSIGDEYRLPLCLDNTWATTEGVGGSSLGAAEVMSEFTHRWTVGVYYVCQVILVIGFGDMITLSPSEIYLLIFMAVFGFIFLRCVIADITAAEVDSDEIRSRYIDQMKCIVTAMQREKVNKKMIGIVIDHLNHTWKQSRGLQPNDIFADLHPALESDLFRSFVGDKLKRVPVFKDFASNVLRSLCKHVKKLYFLSGERVSRYGNLEYEMLIIVSGKIWITDKMLNYGCTLHKNESFGETSLISPNARRYTAIAATNVEVFVISQDDFALVLERYPSVREILAFRTGGGIYDYFEHKIYDMIGLLKTFTREEKNKYVDLLIRRTAEIKHLVYAREPVSEDDDEAQAYIGSQTKKFHQYLIGFGNDDDSLPLLYFVSQRSRKTGKLTYFPPLIHPNCLIMRWFFTFMYQLFYFLTAITFYDICFPVRSDPGFNDESGRVVRIISNNLGYVVLFYIILNFFTPYQDEEGVWIKNSWSVLTNYVASILGFWLDVIATVPPFFIPTIDSESSKETWSKIEYIKGLRCLLLFRYYQHHFSKKDDLTISAFKYKITISVSSFCLMAHFLACIFYAKSSCDRKTIDASDSGSYCEPSTWTHSFSETNKIALDQNFQLPWRWWIRSLYWVTATVSTTGFGDITPRNVGEMFIGILCVFCGAFILSIILSSFTAGMASLTKARREYLYQVKLLVRYLRNIGLSEFRQNQINLYFQKVWDSCRGTEYDIAIQVLPTSMQIEVGNALFESALKHVHFFEISEKALIRQVAAKVTHSIYLPGICIVKEGDPGDLMFIVYKGRVSGVIETDDAQSLKDVYHVGDVFGKLPALFSDAWYTKSYRAEEYTEILALSQAEILNLSSLFKDFRKNLLAYIELNYNPNGEFDCIFSEPRSKAKDLFDLGEDFRKKFAAANLFFDEDTTNKAEKKWMTKVHNKKPHHHDALEHTKKTHGGVAVRRGSQQSIQSTMSTDTGLHELHQFEPLNTGNINKLKTLELEETIQDSFDEKKKVSKSSKEFSNNKLTKLKKSKKSLPFANYFNAKSRHSKRTTNFNKSVLQGLQAISKVKKKNQKAVVIGELEYEPVSEPISKLYQRYKEEEETEPILPPPTEEKPKKKKNRKKKGSGKIVKKTPPSPFLLVPSAKLKFKPKSHIKSKAKEQPKPSSVQQSSKKIDKVKEKSKPHQSLNKIAKSKGHPKKVKEQPGASRVQKSSIKSTKSEEQPGQNEELKSLIISTPISEEQPGQNEELKSLIISTPISKEQPGQNEELKSLIISTPISKEQPGPSGVQQYSIKTAKIKDQPGTKGVPKSLKKIKKKTKKKLREKLPWDDSLYIS